MFAKASALLAAAALFSAPAFAHPKLLGSTPAAGSAAAAPARVELTFSEKLVPQFSSADIVMTGMPGMAAHAPMKMPATSTVSPDGKRLIATPARPLPAGSYRVAYKVVSSDTHRIEGGFDFTVK